MRSLFLFLMVGGSSAVVNLATFTVCWHFFHWPNAMSVTAAYFVSVLVHFLGNRYITFRAMKHQPLWRNLKKYVVMVGINYLISLGVVHVGVKTFALYPPIAAALAIIATVGLGFVLSKLWVFKHQEDI